MKIAIVKLSALGDIVHAMAALQFVKQADARIQIDWLVEERFAGILQDNPDINQILTVNIKALKQTKSKIFAELIKVRNYAKNNYDIVIDAQGLLKSAVTSRILSANTVGFDKNSIRERVASFFYKKTIGYPYDGNTIDRNIAVISRALGFEVSVRKVVNKAPFIFFKELDRQLDHYFVKNKANIVFVIGSTWPSRNYPKEKYLNVIQDLDENSLIIWGNEQEKNDAEWIEARTDKARVLPKLDFNNLKAVLANSDLVIGNDTGPTHIAWGLNKPSITLFGPTPVSRVYQTEINKVLKSPSIVNAYKLDKNDFSIKQIKEDKLRELAQSLLKKS